MTRESSAVDAGPGTELLEWFREHRGEMVEVLSELAGMESPSLEPEAQGPPLDLLSEHLSAAGFRTRRISGRATGGHLVAVPAERVRRRPVQLLVGHCDTVWPRGTLATMPVTHSDGILRGPGTFDMKGGLTLILFALRAVRELELDLPATPVVLVNSDEEIGSPESRRHVARLARRSARAFVLEPAFGPEGRIKTARKGVGTFEIRVRGQAAHAGLEPEKGASAILELAHLIRRLHDLNDREAGTSVNVGVVDGGMRPNVVAAESRAQVDVRAVSLEEARKVETAIRALRPETPGVELEIAGRLYAPPMERTPRNRALWFAVREAGQELGLDLQEVTAGGGSDGNTTSRYTATVDGLGPVGDGAHAPREHVRVESLVERGALLGRLLTWPLTGD